MQIAAAIGCIIMAIWCGKQARRYYYARLGLLFGPELARQTWEAALTAAYRFYLAVAILFAAAPVVRLALYLILGR